jgi:hypothetical protein
MKTPREFLLARHHAANPKLDAIRQRILGVAPPRAQRESALARFVASCREVIRIPRIAWAGLLTTWAVIITLNMASSDATPARNTRVSDVGRRSPEMLQALREQRRLLVELMGSSSIPDVEPSPFVPRPRSQSRPQNVVA